MLEGFFDTLGCLFAIVLWAVLAIIALIFIKTVAVGLWHLLLDIISHLQ